MPDVFIEYLVKRENTPKIMLAKTGIIAAAIIVAFVLIMFSGALGAFSMFAIAAALGAICGAYYLVTSMNIEFEYAVTNGEMDIDKIIARRKRLRVATVNCREAEAFGRYKAGEHAGKTYPSRIFACDKSDSDDLWYCVARLKDRGLTLIVFNANEKMLNGIKPFLPRQVLREV